VIVRQEDMAAQQAATQVRSTQCIRSMVNNHLGETNLVTAHAG
jgi:hypothetical protein